MGSMGRKAEAAWKLFSYRTTQKWHKRLKKYVGMLALMDGFLVRSLENWGILNSRSKKLVKKRSLFSGALVWYLLVINMGKRKLKYLYAVPKKARTVKTGLNYFGVLNRFKPLLLPSSTYSLNGLNYTVAQFWFKPKMEKNPTSCSQSFQVREVIYIKED